MIPRIRPYDFVRFRDQKSNIRQLRNMILGIPDDFIVTEKDINKKVVDQYRREQMETRKKSLKLKDGTTHDPAAMFDHEKSRP